MSATLPSPAVPMTAAASRASHRLLSIDALRGLVIGFMMIDHVRETFYLHLQVPDPMVVADTPADLFFSRMLAHICAPVFVFLTGLSAYLYGSRAADPRATTADFLWKRGLFLVLLEVTVISFGWTFQFPPAKLFLQVIWVIGLSMLALSALLWLPRGVRIGLGVVLIAGHNLLDGLHFPAGHAMHIPWAILHDRGWINVFESMPIRTSYPLLPWIGVILLGHAAGSWFTAQADAARRQRWLTRTGIGLIVGFVLLRALNVYGDRPWVAGADGLQTVMSFLNITKYPPSLLFLMLTLGVGLLLLCAFERVKGRWLGWLAVIGAAPMFFYILHLYVLKALYIAAEAIWGRTHGDYVGVDAVWMLWAISIVLVVALYPAVRAFGALKARRRDLAWLKYL